MNQDPIQQPSTRQNTDQSDLRYLLLGIFGAVAGGVIGRFLFVWIASQGFYALALPGALAGLGAGMLTKQRSNLLAGIVAILAFVAGVWSEWSAFPFTLDFSFSYFVTHLHLLKPLTWIMLILGTVFAFWFSCGLRRSAN